MTAAALLPTRRLRVLARLARWGLWLVLGLWALLLCAWALLHYVIVPGIDQWRPQVQAAASRALGAPVRIARLVGNPEGRRYGLFPTLELHEVSVLDEGGRQALTLPRVVLTLSARSVLRLGLEQLYIDAPQLDVRRLRDGQWRIAGLGAAPQSEAPAPTASAGSEDGDPYRALRWLLAQPEVALRHGSIRLTDEMAAADGPPPVGEASEATPQTLPALQPSPIEQPPAGHSAQAAAWDGQRPEDADGPRVLYLRDVDIVLRNAAWPHVHHALRLDATVADSGQRLHAAARVRESLLANTRDALRGDRHNAPWTRWSGQWYAQLHLRHLPPLPWPQHWHIARAQGQGQVRIWGDVQRGRITDVTADVALHHARIDWLPSAAAAADATADATARSDGPAAASALAPLSMRQLQGRVALRQQGEGWQVQARQLGFVWDDGSGTLRHWPRSDWSLHATTTSPARMRLNVQQADLHIASALMQRLPVPTALRQGLQRLSPSGQVRELQLQWQGSTYEARGQVQGLGLHAHPAPRDGEVGIPGVQGLDVRFALTHEGGSAELAMTHGTLTLPGVFADPVLPLHSLHARTQWTVHDGRWRVSVDEARFANADARASMSAQWQMGAHGDDALPGTLELRGILQRADATRVHRYLPLAVAEDVRAHVRQGVRAGTGVNVRFEVAGDLRHLPFDEAAVRHPARLPDASPVPVMRFRIEAPVSGVTYDYTPPGDARTPWPALRDAQATLVFDGTAMHIQGLRANIGPQARPLRVSGQAHIPDLLDAQLHVSARAQGELQSMLDTVRGSAIEGLSNAALSAARAQGQGTLALEMRLPLSEPQKVTFTAALALAPGRNSFTLSPEVPTLHDVRGQVQIHEQGFELRNLRASALGGQVEITGGMASAHAGMRIQARGQATATGLRRSATQSIVRHIAAHSQGMTTYRADIQHSSGQRQPSVRIETDLRGIAVALPAPLDKPDAQSALALTLSYGPASTPPASGGAGKAAAAARPAGPDQPKAAVRYDMHIAGRAHLAYLLDAQARRVLGGRILLGTPGAAAATGAKLPPAEAAAPLAAGPVVAHVQLARLDADAWGAVLQGWYRSASEPGAGEAASNASVAEAAAAGDTAGSSADAVVGNAAEGAAGGAVQAPGPGPGAPAGQGSAFAAAAAASGAGDAVLSWLPRQIVLDVGSVRAWQREFGNVSGRIHHRGPQWQGQIQAPNFTGEMRYVLPDATYPQGLIHARLARLHIPEAEVKALRSASSTDAASIFNQLPALDIRVDTLALAGRDLGQLHLRARQSTGPSSLPSPGHWDIQQLELRTPEARLQATGRWSATAPEGELRRTQLAFVLDMDDGGALLQRLGLEGFIQHGGGRITGQIGWGGSPVQPHWPSLRGDLRIDLGKGQFLKVNPGAARLLSVLSLQSITRRLTLDFRDLFAQGFAFDFVRGHITVDAGIARTSAMQMQGLAAAVQMDGSIHLLEETQNLRVVVVPEINAMSASLLASTVNPVLGLGSFIAQLFLRNPLREAATRTFDITGTWDDPQVQMVQPQQPQPGDEPAPQQP